MDLVSSCKSFNLLQGDENDALQQTAKSNIIKLRRKFTEQLRDEHELFKAVFDRRRQQRIGGLWVAEDEVLVVALLRVLPFVSRTLSNKACQLSLLGTALSSFYSLYTLYGKPRAWNLPSIQMWFQNVIATKDFIQLIYYLMLVSSQGHFKYNCFDISVMLALELVAKFLRQNFSRSLFYRKYMEEPCVWVESNITTLSILSSNAEIALSFLLILSLFSWQHNIYQTFMYWQAVPLSLLVDSLQGKECLSLHKQLVNNFFKNANHMLRPCEEVHVSHKIEDPFHRWNLKEPTLKNSLILT